MALRCWFKHKWTPVKSFASQFGLYLIWRGFECKRCEKRKLKKVSSWVESHEADNEAFSWLNEIKEKKKCAEIIKLVKK